MERERGPVAGELMEPGRARPASESSHAVAATHLRTQVQAGLAGFDAERHGVFFLDLECPLARLPHSSYAYRSPGHRHLPGGPDLANAILLQFLARVNK